MPFFIEVGSCDFDTCEKLIRNGWKGIVIEPVKYYFDRLTKFPQINYENIAISDKEGESEIHYIDPKFIVKQDQQWLKGISSIEGKSGPLSFETNNKLYYYKKRLKQKVKTIPLNELCKEHNVDTIDFLKIDTEGHDIIVLKSIDLEKINVKMIKIEHKHVSHIDIIKHLEGYGYMCYLEKDDIYAIK